MVAGSLVLSTAAYILCALIVTVDVLLKKSDVRAALGWIGIAWMSPFFGALLYYMFGINRVSRRALKFEKVDKPDDGPDQATSLPDADPHIAELADLPRVSQLPLLAGNRFTLLQHGRNAYPAMLEAIAGAKRSIALASYIFRDNSSGKAFVAALSEAQKRGVEVRVLVDSIGSGYFTAAVWHHLNRLAFRRRAPAYLDSLADAVLNMRNHRKIMVVDGALGFVGGMNIGSEDLRGADETGARRGYSFPGGRPGGAPGHGCLCARLAVYHRRRIGTEDLVARLAETGPVFARGLRSGPDADVYKLEVLLGAALTQAKRRIRIVTPYFLPDQRLQFAIAQAVLRGVEVDIVLPEQSDGHLMQWAMRAHLKFFRHIHANFYFSPPPFDHSKLVTMDEEWCLIGSSNWDTRSFRLNFEFDLECYDRDLTAALDALIAEKIRRAHKVMPEDLRAPVWILLRDAAIRLMSPYL